MLFVDSDVNGTVVVVSDAVSVEVHCDAFIKTRLVPELDGDVYGATGWRWLIYDEFVMVLVHDALQRRWGTKPPLVRR